MKDYIEAHKYCTRNKENLQKDTICGCFYCLEIFSPKEIEMWLNREDTALCPYCCVDSVIGESSGYPITKIFLKKV